MILFSLARVPARVLSIPVRADDTLTWEQCVVIAKKNNPDLISALRAVEATRAQYKGSFNGVLPNLNLSTAYNDGSFQSPDSRWTANGSASMNIFNQSTYASIKSASASLDLSESNWQITSSNVLLSLHQAFATLLSAQQQVEVSIGIRDIRNHDADLVTLSYQSGRESKGDMMRANAQLLEANLDVDQSRRDLVAAQQELSHQLGEDHFSAMVTTGTLNISTVPARPDSWGPIVDQHPSVRVGEAQLALARASFEASRKFSLARSLRELQPFLRGRSLFSGQSQLGGVGRFELRDLRRRADRHVLRRVEREAELGKIRGRICAQRAIKCGATSKRRGRNSRAPPTI